MIRILALMQRKIMNELLIELGLKQYNMLLYPDGLPCL
jgi:hypothetical protein